MDGEKNGGEGPMEQEIRKRSVIIGVREFRGSEGMLGKGIKGFRTE